jgi:hypothetical protein
MTGSVCMAWPGVKGGGADWDGTFFSGFSFCFSGMGREDF